MGNVLKKVACLNVEAENQLGRNGLFYQVSNRFYQTADNTIFQVKNSSRCTTKLAEIRLY